MPQHPNTKSHVEFKISLHPHAVGVLEHGRWGKQEVSEREDVPLNTTPLLGRESLPSVPTQDELGLSSVRAAGQSSAVQQPRSVGFVKESC